MLIEIGDWRLAIGIGDCALPIADCRLPIAISNCDLRVSFRHTASIFGLNFDGPVCAIAEDMNTRAAELQARTNRFAAAVIRFCEALPQTIAVRRIVEQLIDSAGSTDSNYRATCRARSPDEFIAKIGIAAEEADESKGWLELLVSSGQTSKESAQALIQEADELTAIFVKSRKTAEENRQKRKELETHLKRAPRRR